MKYLLFTFFISLLYFSCGNETKQGDLLEIPVDIEQNISLPLSEITEELTAIELEFTDRSPINPNMIKRVVTSKNEIIIAEMDKILVFSKDGKFVRLIGSRGHGPGEYNFVLNIAIDDKNNRLFIISTLPGKIICYDLTGKFLKEFVTHSILDNVVDINYVNGELLVIDQKMGGYDEMGKFTSSSTVYRLDDEFRIVDSCLFRETFKTSIIGFFFTDFILKGSNSIYLYCHEFYPKELAPNEVVLRDTLYHFEKNQLIPELKLKFKNDGIDNGGNKFIDPYNIYRSSRYIFSFYENHIDKKKCYFCYDTKTGKGYNMQDGFTDDINGIDKRIQIRPLITDTEKFYYWHTHMKPDDLEEPNPTLYIGKLKK